jgi:hypothetical protein
MHSVACLPNNLIALSTPCARYPAESTGIDLAHPTSKINSAHLRIDVVPFRDGTAIVLVDGIAQCPRPEIAQDKRKHIRKVFYMLKSNHLRLKNSRTIGINSAV